MATLIVTATSVVNAVPGENQATGIAGASITAGQLLYEDTSDSNKLKLADANGAALLRSIKGVSLHGATSGQPITYQFGGNYNPGATVTVGIVYVLASDTAGGVAPISDLTSNDYVSILGIATTASNIRIQINNTGVVKP